MYLRNKKKKTIPCPIHGGGGGSGGDIITIYIFRRLRGEIPRHWFSKRNTERGETIGIKYKMYILLYTYYTRPVPARRCYFELI